MKANEWKLINQTVETGIKLGVGRFNKHREVPICADDEEFERLCICIENAVMEEISEWFDFEEAPNGH